MKIRCVGLVIFIGLVISVFAVLPVPSIASSGDSLGSVSCDSHVHAAAYQYDGNTMNSSIIWTYRFGTTASFLHYLYHDPVVVNGTVYEMHSNGHIMDLQLGLVAIDAKSGAVKWSSSPGNLPQFSVVNGTVYVLTAGTMHVYDAETGVLKGSYDTSGLMVGSASSSPVVVNDTLFLGSGNGELQALNSITGVPKWNFTTGDRPSSIVVDNGTVFTVGDHLYALDAVTGVKKWSYPIGDGVSTPVVANGFVYIESDGMLVALNAVTGVKKWSHPIGSGVSTPVVANGFVYVNSNGKILALNAVTGVERWSHSAGSGASVPVVMNGSVFYCNGSSAYALNACTGVLKWSFDAGVGVSAPVVANGTVCIVGGKLVFVLDAGTGGLLWVHPIETVGATAPAVADGIVYVASGTTLYALGQTGTSPIPNSTPVPLSSPGIMFRSDPAHTGVYDDGGILPTNATKWVFKTGGAVESSPAIAADVVFSGSDDGNVYAINATSGKLNWNYTTGGPVTSPAAVNGTVFAESGDGKLYALNAASGKLKWNYTTGGGSSSPAVANNTVYITGDNISALDASTGALKWKYSSEGTVFSSPIVAGNIVYVAYGAGQAGSESGFIFNSVKALNASTGETIFDAPGEFTFLMQSTPVVGNGTIYFFDVFSIFNGLNATTGDNKFRSEVTEGSTSDSPAVAGSVVYTSCDDGNVYALDGNTGALLWFFPVNETKMSPSVANGTVYAGSNDGFVYSLNDSTGLLRWKYHAGGVISAPAVANGTVYAGSSDGNIYAIGSPQNTPPSHPSSNLSVTPSSVPMRKGETKTVRLVVNSLPDGLSGYDLILSLGNSSVASITRVSFPAWAESMKSATKLSPGKTRISAVDLHDKVKTGADNVLLAEVTIKGNSIGNTSINLSKARLDSDKGDNINPILHNGTLSVNTATGSSSGLTLPCIDITNDNPDTHINDSQSINLEDTAR